jgi:hypothetical protein
MIFIAKPAGHTSEELFEFGIIHFRWLTVVFSNGSATLLRRRFQSRIHDRQRWLRTLLTWQRIEQLISRLNLSKTDNNNVRKCHRLEDKLDRFHNCRKHCYIRFVNNVCPVFDGSLQSSGTGFVLSISGHVPKSTMCEKSSKAVADSAIRRDHWSTRTSSSNFQIKLLKKWMATWNNCQADLNDQEKSATD